MSEQVKSGYTDDEREAVYNLVDKLPSLYFGSYDEQDWEGLALQLAEIIKAKQARVTPVKTD